MTGRRLPRRTRGACRLGPTGVDCLAFGSEGACALCNMIDFDHPTTCVTLGRYPAHDRQEGGTAAFWAHLARRTDGGPTTPAELDRANDQIRRYRAEHRVRFAQLYGQPESDLPDAAPF